MLQIVDKLQWYIQSGDTIVDFFCGSNDFSLLLKEKLEASGKNCFYRNFDLIQPKNDFSFERRDWMTVQPDELPTGCRLIMGLNPPFGFKASLANQFINKALTFKPKLIILIVPKETERLDKKYPPYELIWQDSQQLAGKSFYLPGSLDADNKVMEQWNMSPPPLSLWSRSDWAKRHSDIAKSMGHLPSENAFSDDCQREVADGPPVPTSGHVEMDALDQLLSDTYHDPTSSPGDYWNDTNGRSRQPCNYETRGRSDPTYAHHAYMGAGSDMSISLSETDCERQDQASSISEHEGVDSQACNAVGSAPAEEPAAAADYAVWSALEEEPTAAADYAVGNASEEEPTAAADYAVGSAPEEEPTAPADYAVGSALEEEPITTADYVVGSAPEEEPTAVANCNEVTSAASPYHLLEDSSQAVRYAAGVQYWRMEDSPLLEEGELSDSPPVGTPAAGAEHQGTKHTPPAVTPEADSHSQSGQPDDSPIADLRPAARHNARTLPPRNTFPGLRFRPGCNSSRQFMSQSMSHPAVHQGPSNGWIDDDDY